MALQPRSMGPGRWLRLAGGLALLLAACFAQAQDCRLDARPADADEGERLLARWSEKSCLGSADQDGAAELTRQVRAALVKKEASPSVGGVLLAVRLLADEAGRQSAGTLLTAEWALVATELQQSQRLLALLPDTKDADSFSAVFNRAVGDGWAVGLAANRPVKVGGGTVQPIARFSCPAAGDCPELQGRRSLIRVFSLMRAVQTYAQDVDLQRQAAQAQLELARWDSYRKDSQHQYIWELALNSQLMARDSQQCPRAGDGGAVGFCKVPTSQWILLHPDAGLRLNQSATQSSELRPALLVELLGYHQFKWQSEQSAQIGTQIGGSLVAAYAQIGDKPRWSFGPMLHLNGYNLAITKGPGERFGVMVSMNLANRYFERKAGYLDPLKNLDKPGLLDLLGR